MKIIGNTVGTTIPKPNWLQEDPTKGDYIHNKDAASEVFIAEYGKASFAEINAARNSGKAVFCYMRDYGITLPLLLIDRVTATFTGMYDGKLRVITNKNDVWSHTTEDMAKVSDTALVVEYGAKSIDAIKDAHWNQDRAVWCKYNGLTLPMVRQDRNTAVFTGMSETEIHMAVNNADEWSYTATEILTEDKVKTLIEENTPEGITEEEVIELVKENAPKGVTSYNELTDVPCGVSDTLTHCVTNDRFYDSTGFYVKVGEFVNPSEFIANGVTITRFPDGAGNQASATYNECESDINGFAYIVGTENVDAVYFVTAIAAELGEEINGKTFPKAGIYFYLEVESVTAEGSGIGVKTLDVKYINTTTEITEASTDEQIPTAKAVVDYVKNNGGGGGASEWSDLGEAVTNLGETLTWDGNTEGKVLSSTNAVHMSDDVLTIEDLTNGGSIVLNDGTSQDLTEVGYEDVGDGVISIGEMVISVPESAVGAVFTKPGIYFFDARPMGAEMYVASFTIPGYNFTESTIKPVPEKYLPTPDWNAKEGEPGYIQNRTHYAEDVEFFSVTDATFSTENNFGMLGVEVEFAGEIQSGVAYTVLWNGESYEYVCDEMEGMHIVGDLTGFMMGNTDIPFCIVRDMASGYAVAVDVVGSISGLTESTNSVALLGKKYHPIDKDYLPKVDWDGFEEGCVPIRNRPIQRNVSASFEWDGDTTGKETVQIAELDGGSTLHLCRIGSTKTDTGGTLMPEMFDGDLFEPTINTKWPARGNALWRVGSKQNFIGFWYDHCKFIPASANKNIHVYVKTDSIADEFGLSAEGVYVAFVKNSDGTIFRYVPNLTLYSITSLPSAYHFYRQNDQDEAYMPIVYATGLKLLSNNKLWEITVSLDGTIKAQETSG